MSKNSILRETPRGTYYTGPLEPAQRMMRDEYGEDLTVQRREDGVWIVTEHRGTGGTHDNPNQWGAGATEEEAWRYLIGTDFGPLDSTYENEGYEANQRRALGLDVTVRGQVLAGLVQILGDQHAITDRKTGLPGPGHPQAVTGCPWCVDDDRAALVDMTLRHLNPDEWSNLSAHTARWVCAVQDLVEDGRG